MKKLQTTIDDIWALRGLDRLTFDTELQKILMYNFEIKLSKCCGVEVTIVSDVHFRCDCCSKSYLKEDLR